MKINLWRIAYQIMWTIRFLLVMFIAVGVGVLVALAFSVFLWCLAGFFLMCLVITGWQKLQASLASRAREKELADRC